MTWQDTASLALVVLAAAYVAWRLRGKRKKGPDVPVKRLRRKR